VRQRWSEVPERGSRGALKVIRWIALNLGRRAARLLLYPITAYFFFLAPGPRFHSRTYLSRVLSRTVRSWDIARHFHSFASVILDRVFLLAGREAEFDVVVHGESVFDEVVGNREGGLLIGSHLGSFEVLRALAISRKHVQLKVLMFKERNALVTRLLDELNQNVAATVIDLGQPNALLQAHEAVQSGALLGMLADRVAGFDRPIRTKFLDFEANFPTGPMRLAAVLGVPVILFFGIYNGGNQYHIYFEHLSRGESVPRSKRDEWVRSMTLRYVQRLESHVRRAPYNWFNFYDFWGFETAGSDSGSVVRPFPGRCSRH